jgi:peptidoglycan/xylan/chitin deacetylase (PgdA/CDA1 family)
VRRIHDEGHTIAHHTYSHSRPEAVNAKTLLAEISQTQQLFHELIGSDVRLFRPPWGKLTLRKYWKLVTSGFGVVLWNVDPKDYAARSTDDVRTWFSRYGFQGGDVVLMHDTHPHAAEVIGDIAAAASARGLAFTTVDRWME